MPSSPRRGGEDDERRPIVRRGAGVRERCLERSEGGAIRACVRSPVCALAGLCRLDREGFQVGVRAAQPVPRDGQLGPGALWLRQRFVEELELASRIDLHGRSVRSHRHARRLPERGRQSLAKNSPPAGEPLDQNGMPSPER